MGKREGVGSVGLKPSQNKISGYVSAPVCHNGVGAGDGASRHVLTHVKRLQCSLHTNHKVQSLKVTVTKAVFN